MRSLKFAIPLAVFVLLAAFFGMGLTRDPRELPSPFVGKPAPAFKLEQLHDAKLAFAPEDMKGKVWLLNVWASWCVSCRIEHPLLVEMSKRMRVPIVGLSATRTRSRRGTSMGAWASTTASMARPRLT